LIGFGFQLRFPEFPKGKWATLPLEPLGVYLNLRIDRATSILLSGHNIPFEKECKQMPSVGSRLGKSLVFALENSCFMLRANSKQHGIYKSFTAN